MVNLRTGGCCGIEASQARRERSAALLEPESSSNAVLIAEAAVFEVQFTIGLEDGTRFDFIILGRSKVGHIEGGLAELQAGTFRKPKAIR
ncbi:MAG: hypothetical protein EZS28_041124 [Streblomastix strix]|uniref:Uncharacterized protein n=1 Tax=Streblomastix strix TaxID=222440 RepID=A0A5J4TZ95_9EUKA|nr:MAG: hypothetical protein EZS28_041124 [Streblomastix strix]